MILIADLKLLTRARLKDAQALYRNKRYDSVVYMGGYAVEVALKARICQTLKWTGFPETNKEFASLQSFKTHDLGVLLSLSGIQARILTKYGVQWSAVFGWSPEMRYRTVGFATEADAISMISAVQALIKAI